MHRQPPSSVVDPFPGDEHLFDGLGGPGSSSHFDYSLQEDLSASSEWIPSSPESYRSSSLSSGSSSLGNSMNHAGYQVTVCPEPLTDCLANEWQAAYPPPQSVLATKLQLELARREVEVQMLRKENEQLRCAITTGPRHNAPPSTSSPSLSEADYPLLQYWQRAKYALATKSDGVTKAEDENGTKMTATSFHFAEDSLGNPPTPKTVTSIKSTTASILHDLAGAGLLSNFGWSKMGQSVKEKFREALEKAHPDLRLCHGHWKADWVVTNIYSSWKATHRARYFDQKTATASEPENMDTIDTDDISSPGPSPQKRKSALSHADGGGKRLKPHSSKGKERESNSQGKRSEIRVVNPLAAKPGSQAIRHAKRAAVPAHAASGTSSVRALTTTAINNRPLGPPTSERVVTLTDADDILPTPPSTSEPIVISMSPTPSFRHPPTTSGPEHLRLFRTLRPMMHPIRRIAQSDRVFTQ
ncbi:hypothetical protein FB45DRAFT_1033337 [Roridomyces roridus]|uniref:Uncharacterized protein n=1 Tax=Roridomyces roridus TaxID=1738132 RepID=A0AAD7BFQ5_9AGAR|nr:hypothetical protein FB45DRAFT_1033337 [Roridomyces roridus]